MKKALACAALVVVAMAVGTAPAAAGDDETKPCKFFAGEYSGAELHYLQSAGGAEILSTGTLEGSKIGATC
ncbi:hypothetical protein ACFPM3_16840 [Streptomyces coeruleoprunus]|uniref:Secreted protein n=1 Tax=Streptomyces coeruleoprunus TaxID=285563 RepID=A0ABV9XGJ6_9ACTN